MADRLRLKGKVYWCNGLFEAQTLTSPDGKTDTFFGVLFSPDDNYLDTLYDLQRQGMKNQIGRDPDKGFTIRFKRPLEKKIRGEMVDFGPPKVKDASGHPWNKDELIPNGSEATVDLIVYSHQVPNSTKKAKAVRLEEVQIVSLANVGNGATQET